MIQRQLSNLVEPVLEDMKSLYYWSISSMNGSSVRPNGIKTLDFMRRLVPWQVTWSIIMVEYQPVMRTLASLSCLCFSVEF